MTSGPRTGQLLLTLHSSEGYDGCEGIQFRLTAVGRCQTDRDLKNCGAAKIPPLYFSPTESRRRAQVLRLPSCDAIRVLFQVAKLSRSSNKFETEVGIVTRRSPKRVSRDDCRARRRSRSTPLSGFCRRPKDARRLPEYNPECGTCDASGCLPFIPVCGERIFWHIDGEFGQVDEIILFSMQNSCAV